MALSTDAVSLILFRGKFSHTEKTMASSDLPRPAIPKDPLVRAVRRLLRPLVHLLVSRSIQFPLVAELLRSLYVEVAAKEFTIEGKRQTDSRVSLLTGVHRKDVRRLRAEHHPDFAAPRTVSLGSQLVARWTTEHLDDHGAPRRLPRLGSAPSDQSFETLVRSISKDIRSRVVLDEWVRLGIVHIDDDDHVCLNVQAFVPTVGADELAYFFGRNLHDHIAVAAHNVLGRSTPLVERSVYYNNLSDASVNTLEELARTRGMELLQEVNARALTLQRRDSGKHGATSRMSFGQYFLSKRALPEEDPGDAG
jgi:hypothetical protein